MTNALARAVLAAAPLILLGACAGPARQEVDSLSQVNGMETIVVGRVELVPALRKDEQKMKALNSGSYANKVFLLADENNRVLKSEPKAADYSGRIEAIFGKSFFVRSSSRPFFILGGVLFLDDYNKAYFPGGLKVSIQPGDRAVYVGTLRYQRNEFFEITKVTVDDDYQRAGAEFRKKFGTQVPLRKALLTPAK